MFVRNAKQLLPHAEWFDILLLKNNPFPDGFHRLTRLILVYGHLSVILQVFLAVALVHPLDKFPRLPEQIVDFAKERVRRVSRLLIYFCFSSMRWLLSQHHLRLS